MVMYQPGAAGVEHYRTCFATYNPDLSAFVVPPTSGPRPKNLYIGGSPVNITLSMVLRFIPAGSVLHKILERNENSMEYEVGGFLLWCLSLPEYLLHEMDRLHFFEVPLLQWKDGLKPVLDMVRRMGMLGCIRDDSVYMLRKAMSVCYRRDDEADWALEMYERVNLVFYKTMLSGGSYREELMKSVLAFEKTTISKVASRNDTDDFHGWWEKRHHLVPSGSTSSTWVRKQMGDEVKSADRPNKRSVSEALPMEFPYWALSTLPIHVGRASTKMEPGWKARALYADNDLSYFITAFASTHCEKEMNHRGCCARQTPADFMMWASATTIKNRYWVSADFNNYNLEHTLEELQILDAVRALLWAKIHTKVGFDKGCASLWSSVSHDLTFAEFPGVGSRRIFQGLFSGSRDTQRNNTVLHTSHSYLARLDGQRLGYSNMLPLREGYEFYSGDDEDSCFPDAISAAIYIKILCLQGHSLNPRKQLAGREHHEFLQTMAHPKSLGQRPLAAILATLASGNWYSKKANWYVENLNGVADNWWEAVCRGLPAQIGFHMACSFLDTLMRVVDEDGKRKELEWWTYRTNGIWHPLWQAISQVVPVKNPIMKHSRDWPTGATDAWMQVHRKVLQHVPERKKELYRNDLLMSSHGSVLSYKMQKALNAVVYAEWPVRERRIYRPIEYPPAPGFTLEEIATFGGVYSSREHPKNEEELCAWLGVDPAIQTLVGTLNHLAPYLSGQRWSKYAKIVPSKTLSPRASMSNWAFRSWAANIENRVNALHVVNNTVPATRLLYIYSPNGGGKTWLVNHNVGWVDIDKLAAPIGLDKPKYGKGLERYTKRTMFISLVLDRAIQESAKVLLGQWAIEEVVDVASSKGIHIKTFAYDPGLEVRMKRMRQRGWDDDSIAHRAGRWISYVDTISDWRELVVQANAALAARHWEPAKVARSKNLIK